MKIKILKSNGLCVFVLLLWCIFMVCSNMFAQPELPTTTSKAVPILHIWSNSLTRKAGSSDVCKEHFYWQWQAFHHWVLWIWVLEFEFGALKLGVKSTLVASSITSFSLVSHWWSIGGAQASSETENHHHSMAVVKANCYSVHRGEIRNSIINTNSVAPNLIEQLLPLRFIKE